MPSTTPTLPRAAGAIIDLALAEDVGRGDITTESTVAADAQATGEILQKQAGVLEGGLASLARRG